MARTRMVLGAVIASTFFVGLGGGRTAGEAPTVSTASKGCPVDPNIGFVVSADEPNSGPFVDPTTIAPASSNRWTMIEVASRGGRVDELVIAEGEVTMTIHLVPGTDVRGNVDEVEDIYPGIEMVSRKQVSTSRPTVGTLTGAVP